jgi:hypothetical protein
MTPIPKLAQKTKFALANQEKKSLQNIMNTHNLKFLFKRIQKSHTEKHRITKKVP